MARTLALIYQAIIDEKNTHAELSTLQPSIDDQQTLLTDITTASRVAVWRLFAFMVALAIWTHEKLWDLFKSEVQAMIDDAQVATLRWWKKEALAFQLGYTLMWIDDKFQYSDTLSSAAQAARIIKRAAAIEVGGAVRVKLATLSGVTVQALSAPGLAAAAAYLNQIKPAGINLSVTSGAPDSLRLYVKCYYDPLVLAGDGSLLTDSAVFPVEDAINNYISNLDFNGAFVNTKCTDAMQAATGVKNPIITLAQARYGALPFNTVTESYTADAGYMTIDGGAPLNTTITYVPSVN